MVLITSWHWEDGKQPRDVKVSHGVVVPVSKEYPGGWGKNVQLSGIQGIPPPEDAKVWSFPQNFAVKGRRS